MKDYGVSISLILRADSQVQAAEEAMRIVNVLRKIDGVVAVGVEDGPDELEDAST